MFYSQFILAKKGPLGTIWIAAHLERKLRKNQVAETDIGVTVDNILFPEVPIALRLSGHLLLGVVRIYSRQVNYLFNDCSETLGKIKQAFHAAAVDLPPEATTAPFHSITLPETFDFDELELAPDSESSFLHLNGNYVDHHVTTREQITLQDCIENNPYLGSSQFGLDERFGDGSYSLLGLDFDEEFLADKPRSLAGASTSTPLLKQETIVPSAGCENEGTHMDVDDHCEPFESERQFVNLNGGVVNNASELGQIERDGQLNTSVPTVFLDPLKEPAVLQVAPRKDTDFAVLKPDTPAFHAYTPRVLEACTPDLNQEYCPPDEPSTPALVDETSFPMYKECVVESAGRFSPVMSGNAERNFSLEPLPRSLLPHQVSIFNSRAAFAQAIRSPCPPSFQGFPLQQEQSPSPASFQGFPLQQAAPAEVNTEIFVTQDENGQILSGKGNAAAVSTVFGSFPQLTCYQQSRTAVSHKGAVFTAEASNSLFTSPAASITSSHQHIGNSSATVNNQWAGTINQEASPRFQQQGLAVNPHNPESSFGVMVESSVLQPLSTMQNYVANQVLASPFVSQASIFPSIPASSGSVLSMENVLFSRQTENMDLDTEVAHETQAVAATKGLLGQSAAQQDNASSSVAMPVILSPSGMGECETLRSAYDLQRGNSDFLLLQKDMSDKRIPGLESDRNKCFSVGIDGVTKEAILPELDKTPIFEETPFMATTASLLSTHGLASLPGDDDVLASILGRKSKAFKVVSTPKVPKAPKANAAAKRPKKVPRVTPKKRKSDFDTVAVLHGDVIRQQLAITEDIRRERRKAPCTRREVWGFIRESEGQENFDEPTLPELSPDLHDLYHDVLHGPESRPPSSAFSGATNANQALASELVRSGESDCLVDCVSRDAHMLDTRGESDLFVDCMNKDSIKDGCPNDVVANAENHSLENCAEQLNEDMKVETAQANPCGDSTRAEDMEKLIAEKLLEPEVDSKGLAEKERDTNSLPEPQGPEDHTASSIISRETGENEQALQGAKLDREIELTGQALGGDIMVSSLAENIVGVVGADVGNQGIAMALQQHTENSEEKKQLSSGLDQQNPHEGEDVMLSKDADINALDVLSDGKDATEVPISKAVDIDEGNVEDNDKVPTSNLAAEERNLCRNDNEMAVMEFERDTDFLDEDNDVAYAEIDYSSDEQDVSIQDNGGWSARSRNVGRYLKTVFEEMEGSSKRSEQGATLGLQQLLARKTKREAARMFFETLVLKSKDYIHVEQRIAYQDIHLYPRSKLMKTEF